MKKLAAIAIMAVMSVCLFPSLLRASAETEVSALINRNLAEVGLTTASNDANEFPAVAEGNENLLDLPGFTNRLSSNDVTNNGDTFTITKKDLNKNVIVTNDYLSSFRFYRPDVDEYSDGTDIDWLFETTLEFGEYYGTEGWYGMGVIIGETDKGYIRLRAMSANYLILGYVAKDTGYDVAGFDYSFAWGTNCAKGSKVAIKIYNIDNVLTIFVNGNNVFSEPVDMTLKLGVHAIYNQGKLTNTSFRFIQPVAPAQIEAKSEETAQFNFSRGKLKSDKAETAISGDIESFKVALKQKENYFVMNSKGAGKSELYRMTGVESYEVVKQSSLATLVSMKLKDIDIDDDGDVVIAFSHNDKGIERTLLRILKSGVATIETGSNTLTTLATSNITPGAENEITAIITNGKIAIKINGEYLFKNVDIPEIAHAIAFGGKNAEYTVNELSYRYVEDVRFEEPQKEQFKPIEWEGEANVEYIAPTLPEKLPEQSGGSGCGAAVGGSSMAFMGLIATALVVLKKRK